MLSTQLTEKLPLRNYQFVCLQAGRGMLPRPKRFVLIKLKHFLGIVETLGKLLPGLRGFTIEFKWNRGATKNPSRTFRPYTMQDIFFQIRKI